MSLAGPGGTGRTLGVTHRGAIFCQDLLTRYSPKWSSWCFFTFFAHSGDIQERIADFFGQIFGFRCLYCGTRPKFECRERDDTTGRRFCGKDPNRRAGLWCPQRPSPGALLVHVGRVTTERSKPPPTTPPGAVFVFLRVREIVPLSCATLGSHYLSSPARLFKRGRLPHAMATHYLS